MAHVELELSLYEKADDVAVIHLNAVAKKLEKLLEIAPADKHGWYNLGVLHLELAKRDSTADRNELLERGLAELAKTEAIKPGQGSFDLARGYALMGRKDESIKWLKEWLAVEKNNWMDASFKEDFAKLQDDPQFLELTK